MPSRSVVILSAISQVSSGGHGLAVPIEKVDHGGFNP